MPTQFDRQDPLTQYPAPPFPKQEQPKPGSVASMDPRPDHGEDSYLGLGRMRGRKALITGADSGIGRAVAIAFAREGADVALNFLDAELTDAREVETLVEAAGSRAVLLPGDISQESVCTELVNTANAELGGLDCLVMVAAHQRNFDSIDQLTTENLDHTFRTNVYSLIWLVKAAVPLMSPGATIITTSSVQSGQPSPDKIDYAASKAAITNLTISLGEQLAPKGIRVNCVAPGPFWTPLQPVAEEVGDFSDFGEKTPMKRPGQPAELGSIYVHLATQESSFMTGASVLVAGGMPG